MGYIFHDDNDIICFYNKCPFFWIFQYFHIIEIITFLGLILLFYIYENGHPRPIRF